jgi:cation diffusion facilitator CzcD-associated flavoprotein CzcO
MSDKQNYDSLVTCIGTGFSGICVGAQLQRWYGVDDVVFFDRQETCGGTWWINAYPGIACDVPAPLYSLSFEQTSGWSSLFPPGKDIKAYLDCVAHKYNLQRKMRFSSEVKSCTWDSDNKVWQLHVKDLQTSETYYHTTKILFAACGQLLRPNELDVPGVEDFSGPVFHSARWRKDVDCKGKKVVVIGNGCTAAQIVPSLLKSNPPSSITQVIRSKHYILPAPKIEYTPMFRFLLAWIPGALWLLRLSIFLAAELSFPFFYTGTLASWYRRRATSQAQQFMRSRCPPEYHDAVIPEFELGCKRRIFDQGYLQSLHDPRVDLETRRAVRVVSEGSN